MRDPDRPATLGGSDAGARDAREAIALAIRSLHDDLVRLGVDRSTIDELADHVASAIEARIAVGDDLTSAIATARTQLGDLSQLAGEHRRVRGVFGPRPSRAVAWSAAIAMFAWLFVVVGRDVHAPVVGFVTGFGAIYMVAIGALLFRAPHAAGFLLGVAINQLVLLVENGYLAGFAALDPHAITLTVLSAGCCIVLAGRNQQVGVLYDLVHWVGMPRDRTAVVVAVAVTMAAHAIATIAGAVFVAVVAYRADRRPRALLAELRVWSGPDAPA